MKLKSLLDQAGQMLRQNVLWSALPLLLAIPLLASLAPTAHSQTYAPYSDFEELTDEQLARVQVKITHLVPFLSLEPSLILTASPSSADISLFEPFRSQDHNYSNDVYTDWDGNLDPAVITITMSELKSLIAGIEDLPSTNDASPHQWASYSLAFLYTEKDTALCFERIYDRDPARAFLTRLRSIFFENRDARIILTSMACFRDLQEATIGENVTSHVIIKASRFGFHANLDPPRYVGTITVTNVAWRMLLAPVSLVLSAEGGVHLMNAYNHTCKIFPMSAPYINLSVGEGLASGESASVTVWFASPNGKYPNLRWNNGVVDIEPVVVAGRGER